MLDFSDVLILGETWLGEQTTPPTLEKFNVLPNNVGRGKGLVIYYKEDKAIVENIHTDVNLQMSVAVSDEIEVIGFYRSAEDKSFISVLENWLQPMKSYLLIGDMNVCSKTETDHGIFKTLNEFGFTLITKEPTHIWTH